MINVLISVRNQEISRLLLSVYDPVNPLLAVINRLFISLPPKQTFAVQFSGTGIFPMNIPFLLKICHPFSCKINIPYFINCHSIGTHFTEQLFIPRLPSLLIVYDQVLLPPISATKSDLPSGVPTIPFG